MHLTIVDKQTNKEIGKFQANDWLEAVQYVESNKAKYMVDAAQLEVVVLNKKGQTHCFWLLTTDTRDSIMNDRLYPLTEKTK